MLIPLESLVDSYNLNITGVLHVGAHIGEERFAYQNCGIKDVVWIEANPELIGELRANVEPFGHRVIQALVTDKNNGERTFHVTNNFQSSSVFEFGTHSIVSPDVHFTHDIVLPTRTIASLADEYGFAGLNFMNLDLQGAELIALYGAGDDLLGEFDYIYTEINVDELYKNCARIDELDRFLIGFRRVETAMAGNAGWGDAFYMRIN